MTPERADGDASPRLHRRTVLGGGAAVVLLAGCLDSDEASPGDDSDPIDAPPEELVLAPVHFSETGWQLEEEDADGPDHLEREFRHLNDEWVRAAVWTFDDVETARSAFEERFDERSDDTGFEEIDDVGVEAFGSTRLGRPRVVFRDANVIGETFQREGELHRALDFAVKMHEHWRS